MRVLVLLVLSVTLLLGAARRAPRQFRLIPKADAPEYIAELIKRSDEERRLRVGEILIRSRAEKQTLGKMNSGGIDRDLREQYKIVNGKYYFRDLQAKTSVTSSQERKLEELEAESDRVWSELCFYAPFAPAVDLKKDDVGMLEGKTESWVSSAKVKQVMGGSSVLVEITHQKGVRDDPVLSLVFVDGIDASVLIDGGPIGKMAEEAFQMVGTKTYETPAGTNTVPHFLPFDIEPYVNVIELK